MTDLGLTHAHRDSHNEVVMDGFGFTFHNNRRALKRAQRNWK